MIGQEYELYPEKKFENHVCQSPCKTDFLFYFFFCSQPSSEIAQCRNKAGGSASMLVYGFLMKEV